MNKSSKQFKQPAKNKNHWIPLKRELSAATIAKKKRIKNNKIIPIYVETHNEQTNLQLLAFFDNITNQTNNPKKKQKTIIIEHLWNMKFQQLQQQKTLKETTKSYQYM